MVALVAIAQPFAKVFGALSFPSDVFLRHRLVFFPKKERETPHRNILHDRWAAAIIIDVESRSADVASDLMSIRFSFSLPCISVYFFSAETPLRQNGGSPTHTHIPSGFHYHRRPPFKVVNHSNSKPWMEINIST